jgi:UTP--glucose-1-phosphate uridylyltransferase
MTPRRVVITAAGLGTRLLPASKEIPKEMFPVFAMYDGEVVVKPLLQIIFESFYDAGFREFCFVVGRGKRAIEDHFTPDWGFVEWLRSRGRERLAKLLEDFYRRVERSHIVWVNQHEPLGFGHAVLMAEPFIDGDFMVAAGDTVLPSSSFIGDMASMGSEVVLIVKKVEDPRRYGVAVLQGDKVVKVVEKPRDPPSSYAILPFYRFPGDFLRYLRRVSPGYGGEIQLTDAIQFAIDDGRDVRAIIYDGEYIDIGSPETYLKALEVFSKLVRGGGSNG